PTRRMPRTAGSNTGIPEWRTSRNPPLPNFLKGELNHQQSESEGHQPRKKFTPGDELFLGERLFFELIDKAINFLQGERVACLKKLSTGDAAGAIQLVPRRRGRRDNFRADQNAVETNSVAQKHRCD